MAADQRRVWTAIADAFDRTRRRPWPHCEAFLRALPPGARVLDLMCGNGRHARAAAAAGHRVLAVDWSAPLLAKAAGPGVDAVLADAAALPLRDGCADAGLFAAGLHGVPSPEGRAAALRELRRALRPGAPAQVTVWSRDAPRFRALGQPGRPVDAVVPWRCGGRDEPRAYHLYTAEALRADLEAAGLGVASVQAVAIAAAEPDNLVALVHKN